MTTSSEKSETVHSVPSIDPQLDASQPKVKYAKWLPLVLLLCFLLLFSIGITKIFLQFQATKNANTAATIVTLPTSSPNKASDTSNWKTYSNSSLGFRLKYPSEWTSVPCSSKDGTSIRFGIGLPQSCNNDATGDVNLFVSTSQKSGIDDLKASPSYTVEEKQRTIQGTIAREALVTKRNINLPGPTNFTIVEMTIKGNLYRFNADVAKGNIFDQILSTFTFTDTKPLPTQSSDNNQTVCTMDAKVCSDGSSVGRTGPNCEFAPCP